MCGSSNTVYYEYLGGLPSPFTIMPPHSLQFCAYFILFTNFQSWIISEVALFRWWPRRADRSSLCWSNHLYAAVVIVDCKLFFVSIPISSAVESIFYFIMLYSCLRKVQQQVVPSFLCFQLMPTGCHWNLYQCLYPVNCLSWCQQGVTVILPMWISSIHYLYMRHQQGVS
jgi:hypothetical protein